MSQASTTRAKTITPVVTVVWSGMSCLLSLVTMAPSLMGLPATSGQHDVVLSPLLTPRCSRSVVGLATVLQQQPLFQMSLQAYANYAIGPPLVGFSFRVEPPTVLYLSMIDVCSGVCILLSGAMMDAVFTYERLNHWGLHHCNPLELTHGRHMCNLLMVIGPHQVHTEWLVPLLL